MKYRTATVTIHAQVFVPEYELADALELKYTEDKSMSDQLQDVQPSILEAKFEEMAKDKIYGRFEEDDPLKLRDLFIDMQTFR